MDAKNMLIIQDASGEIVAAQVVDPADSEIHTFISPAEPGHTLSEVAEVPAEIADLANPEEFQRAITDYVRAGYAKVRQTSADELKDALLTARTADPEPG
ncbi:hypothetical protein [Pseudarthrobacter sulfonivorans]|uniref:hypothetical protein n=1 Tax=Pseudarthrobacter sulfonivorans TaxID=121292 RepID=UPI0028550CF0|nr:hypothetical protein [Pseudarthrobacter sulfonivorans]MDR6415289.1 hypothetical protein [Pseudarthrobacter sulfonivorans]